MTRPGQWRDDVSDYREILARLKAIELGKPSHNYLDFTPTVTTVTLGTGGTLVARYSRIGNVVSYFGKITLGTGGSFTGSPVTISLPFTASAYAQIGVAGGNDTGSRYWTGVARIAASDTTFNAQFEGNTFLAATSPFTWGNTDILEWHITYECAT